MRVLIGIVLFAGLSVVFSQTDVCPTDWYVACSRPLSQFTKQKNPRTFCKKIGLVLGDSCVITPLQGVIPNGCCPLGK